MYRSASELSCKHLALQKSVKTTKCLQSFDLNKVIHHFHLYTVVHSHKTVCAEQHGPSLWLARSPPPLLLDIMSVMRCARRTKTILTEPKQLFLSTSSFISLSPPIPPFYLTRNLKTNRWGGVASFF